MSVASAPADELDSLVRAALRVAAQLGRDIADVPVAAIATEAGISRSTLLRRLGGSRSVLDDAVRAAGVDPGGQPPVRTRALDAAAELISESGLAAMTLDRVAEHARCSADSLYSIFGSRDELVRSVFERHSPILNIEDFVAHLSDGPRRDLTTTVRQLYALIVEALQRKPMVGRAIMAEALYRPESPAVRSVIHFSAPRLLGSIGRWLADEISAGRLRDLPVPLLVQQLLAPLLVHTLLRPATDPELLELPDLEQTCAVFAEAFVRAAGTGQRIRKPRT